MRAALVRDTLRRVLTKYPTTKSLTLSDGTVAVLTRANGRAAAVAAVDLLAACGPTLAGMIGGGGLRVSATESIPFGELVAACLTVVRAEAAKAEAARTGGVAPAELLEAGASALLSVSRLLGGLLASARLLDGARLLAIADFLVLGRLELELPGAAVSITVSDGTLYDAHVSNPMDVMRIGQAAIVLSLGPIFAGAGGDQAPAKA